MTPESETELMGRVMREMDERKQRQMRRLREQITSWNAQIREAQKKLSELEEMPCANN